MRLLKNENCNNNKRKQMVGSFARSCFRSFFDFSHNASNDNTRTIVVSHMTQFHCRIETNSKIALKFFNFWIHLSFVDGDLIWTKFMSKLFWQQIILFF